MELSIWTFLIVCPLTFLGGFVDAVAGGGGLISLPAYMIAGVPVHNAIATNKLSSGMGTTISTYRLARLGYIPWRRAALCILMAMIFRNVYLIFKTAEGETKFSQGKTPFQKDNIRMVREIGIFCIAIPVVELIVSVIARIVLPVGVVETSVEMTGVFMGLVVLCLSQFFAYGMELQEDVDGLV